MNDEEENEVEMDEVDTEQVPETTAEEPTLASEVIDMVIDGNAADAKEAIYGLLYQKVGERIDSLKGETRSNSWNDKSESEPTEEV